MGSCCRHDSVISLMNIFESGENRALALSILKQILDNVNQTRPVGVLYDIGCSLNKFIKLVSNFFLYIIIHLCWLYHMQNTSAAHFPRAWRTSVLWHISLSCICTWMAMSAWIQSTLQRRLGLIWWRINGAIVVGAVSSSQSIKICNSKQPFECARPSLYVSKQRKYSSTRYMFAHSLTGMR
jgi:hypothetical protein